MIRNQDYLPAVAVQCVRDCVRQTFSHLKYLHLVNERYIIL